MILFSSSRPGRLAGVGVAALACAALAFGQLGAASAEPPAAQTPAVAVQTPDLRDAMVAAAQSVEPYAADEVLTAIVDLTKPTALDVPGLIDDYGTEQTEGDEQAAAAYREELKAGQARVAQAITGLYPQAVFRYSFTNLLNGFAVKLPWGLFEQVKAIPGVADVWVSQTYTPELQVASVAQGPLVQAVATDSGSTTQMGLEAAWNAGFTGAGKVLAIFDSGIYLEHEQFSYMNPDITAAHPDNYKSKADVQAIIDANPDMNLFKHDWGSWFHGFADPGFKEEGQQAAREGKFWYNEKVPFQADYIYGKFDARSSRWAPFGSEHGTHVSGIAAGNAGPNDRSGMKGSAPDAQIMFFKVFDDFDSAEQEYDESLFAALDDAVTLGVNAFNLSLGIPNGHSTYHTYAQAGYQKAYNRAKQHGISVQVSAGNSQRDANSGILTGMARAATRPNQGTGGFSGTLFSPMTVSSANGGGHVSGTVGSIARTTVNFTKAADGTQARASIQGPTSGDFTDSVYGANRQADPPGIQGLLPGSYPLVDVGAATEETILAAGNATELADALAGKVALVSGALTAVSQANGNNPPGITDAARITQERLIAAHPLAIIACGTTTSAGVAYYPQSFVDLAALPFVGNLGTTNCTNIRSTLTANPEGVNVSFNSARPAAFSAGTLDDLGPSSFTSWGVTESLRLKPEIMAPGGNIYSATWTNPGGYVSKSGTSMASPNSEGAIALIQQIVDKKIDDGVITGVAKHSQAYANLVDQFTMSNALPYTGTVTGTYFSPRRQGAGMIRVDKVLNSNVSLRNEVVFDPETGEAPRAKVELGDKVGDQFSFSFVVDNFNTASRTFQVSAAIQTDATTVSNGRRQVLAGSSTDRTASEVLPLPGAVIRVTGVEGGQLAGDEENVNKYSPSFADPAAVSVPRQSSARVTVSVDLSGVANLAELDTWFPNGLFLDGFVFLDSSREKVSIPFMGFRGDWNASPLFDTLTAYQSRTGKSVADLDYPSYHVSALATLDGSVERVLGANQYSPAAAWPTHNSSGSVSAARTWLDNQRNAGNLQPELTAFSPDGDGQFDLVYANLALLREAKALAVVVKDNAGNVVKTLGPDYEFFELLNGDACQTQQIAATYGTKYQRRLAWDGTDNAGQPVADGQYSYEVRAVLEHAFLKDLGYPSTDAAVLAYLTDPANQQVQSLGFAVKVDRTAPSVVLTAGATEGSVALAASDDQALQAVGLYNGSALVGSVRIPSTPGGDYAATIVLPDGVSAAQLTAQAVDFAGNVASSSYSAVNGNLQALIELVHVHELYEQRQGLYTSLSYQAMADALTAARVQIAVGIVTDAQFAGFIAAFQAAVAGLVLAVDTSGLELLIDLADAILADPGAYVPTHLADLAAAVAAARALLVDPLLDQDRVTVGIRDLAEALARVELKGDKAVLDALIAVVQGLDPDRFTPASWAPVAAALAAGLVVSADVNASASQVDAAVTGLTEAIDLLVLRAAKAGLLSAISVANNILANTGAYVPSSLTGLADARDAAQTVYDNADATQAQVTAAQTALLARVAAVKLRNQPAPVIGSAGLAKLAPEAAPAAAAVKLFATTPTPRIKGTAKVGKTLQVKLGKWSNKPSLSVQWYRNGKPISGATKTKYKVAKADKGKRLTLKVTATKAGYRATIKTSSKTKKIK
ncbi:MAG: S8 family serine peptidase [Bifidobacteriaceae bacterium]|jgi:hypothetical protein|nr:S8 family serine peptidase [Bifidobacteriaceae bacterium]